MLGTIKNQMITGVLILILLLQLSAATIQFLQAKSFLMQGLESEAKNVTTPLLVAIERKLNLFENENTNIPEFFNIHMRVASFSSYDALIKIQDKLEEIRFVGKKGMIKAHRDHSKVNHLIPQKLIPMIGKQVKSLEIDDQIHVFIPSYFKNEYFGGMLLSYSNRQMTQARTRVIVISLGLLLVYMLIGTVVTILISRTITHPIEDISKSIKIIASGNFYHEINIKRRDELGGLAKSFSEMRDAIIEKIELKDQAQKETSDMQEKTVLELKRLDKLKDEFLAKTSHELRTPLHGIMGISELLYQQANQIDSNRLKQESKTIYACGKRLSTTIDDILDYSKLKNDTLKLQTKPIELKSQVQLIIDLLSFMAKGKKVKIINEIPSNYVVIADENRLQQILQNLVGNAIKFTSEGWIMVRAREIGSNIEIEVTDTGIGIENSQHEMIFKSFKQVESNQNKGNSGTGLGLSIAKHIVELHGGTIRVTSDKGTGTSFFFTLPKSDLKSQISIDNQNILGEIIDSKSTLKSQKENTILVIEDEPTVRHVIVSNLEDQYNVIEAVNGQDGWEKLMAAKNPSLILLDLMLPIVDGFTLCERIRANEQFQHIPIVILTAKSMIDDFAIALQLGANDFLRKPIGREALLARVKNNLLENRSRITSPGCWTIYCHLDKIAFIQSEKHGSLIHLEETDRTIKIQTSFSVIKKEFKTQLYLPHQNFLINSSKKAWIRNRTNWDFELVFADGKSVPISRRIYPMIKDNYERLKS